MMNRVKSRWFVVERVLGKVVLSPLLSNIYMMEMVDELERAQLGVQLEECWYWALIYADDIVLVVDSGMEMHTKLEGIQAYVMRWRISSTVRRVRLW